MHMSSASLVQQLKALMHDFLNTVEVPQSYKCAVKRLEAKSVETLKTCMLKIGRMWKCGKDSIYFGNIFCICGDPVLSQIGCRP
jgi:hypothetical protein